MKLINQMEYEICKKYGLLFDGEHVYDSIDKAVLTRAAYKNNVFGRNYVRTKRHYWITEGRNGIDGSLSYFMKKEVENNGS
jgi:hypothetical protein